MLFASHVIVQHRDTKACETIAQVVNVLPGGDKAAVARVHDALRAAGPEGDALRRKYSSALFVVDNSVRNQYDFPDPDDAARKLAENQLAAARREHASANQELDRAMSHAETLDEKARRARERVRLLEARLTPVVPPPGDEGEGTQNSSDHETAAGEGAVDATGGGPVIAATPVLPADFPTPPPAPVAGGIAAAMLPAPPGGNGAT